MLSEPGASPSDNIYECEFDEEFDVDVPIGQCKALYDFDGERTLSSSVLHHTHPTDFP